MHNKDVAAFLALIILAGHGNFFAASAFFLLDNATKIEAPTPPDYMVLPGPYRDLLETSLSASFRPIFLSFP